MLADSHILHISDGYRITDCKCRCDVCSLSATEYNQSFCISFIRKGFFEYRTFRRSDEMHAGRILLSRPGFEHTAWHATGQADVTTEIDLSTDSLAQIKEQYGASAGWFLNNDDVHALLLRSNPEFEYLHHCILQVATTGNTTALALDDLVWQLVGRVFSMIGVEQRFASVPEGMRKHHLRTIEQARDYLLVHFRENVSLQQLARHCAVSVFHFSRLFETVTGVSPHRYLVGLRLEHARVLLASTVLSVSEIAFECGFGSAEHFSTCYRQHFKVSPLQYRKQVA